MKPVFVKRRNVVFAFLLVATISFVGGGVAGRFYRQIGSRVISGISVWDNTSSANWPGTFSLVRIRSSVDASLQPAYFFAAPSETCKPLVVSLHSWSGDFSQADPIAELAEKEGWNYIHPNFRGPNSTREACLSNKVIADIDDAIQYAKDQSNIDASNIFVVGVSGGGHAVLGSYLKTTHQVNAFLAWVPISDLAAWFYQSKKRQLKYAQDIVRCTTDGDSFDRDRAKERSPLFWKMPAKPNGKLEIYAGIDDGYDGSVPISHSILFFNRVAEHYGCDRSKIDEADIVSLLTREIAPSKNLGVIGNHAILYKKDTKPASLVIFDGTHEMLPEYCFDRMKRIVRADGGK